MTPQSHFCGICASLWQCAWCHTRSHPALSGGAPAPCPPCAPQYWTANNDWNYLDEFENWVKKTRKEAGV